MRERQLVEDRRASAEREAHERVELERLALERMRIQMDREVRLEEARIKEATEADESAQLKRYGQASRSRTLCARLDPQIRDDYFRMKQTLLKDLGSDL